MGKGVRAGLLYSQAWVHVSPWEYRVYLAVNTCTETLTAETFADGCVKANSKIGALPNNKHHPIRGENDLFLHSQKHNLYHEEIDVSTGCSRPTYHRTRGGNVGYINSIEPVVGVAGWMG